MDDGVKVIIAFFVMAAVVLVALAVSTAYTDIPRQYGDKVCVKIMKELKCEPISAE